ncbi:N-6 DNA methylase [Aerococcaceae bacterium zg-ZJ1578]|uniref:N-6 DNA methylase n=1 Tax=Aerococcaceae bacterium zg-252 TaxID=2796928 RepID=UPI001A2655C3|nr:N-6 DNA methylase [Aerococcaceae bacterium zg-1578]
MTFKEHNNRLKANQFAEYITGETLRRYVADKVHHYVGTDVTVFDGAVGSGQLEQFVQPRYIYGVEIQDESCKACRENFPNSDIMHQSFFAYDGDVVADCVIMNPPFSLAFKDLPEEDKAQIQKEFPWKKSGKVDDIFLLKSLKHTSRFAFYIMFPGIAYRNTERIMRQEVGERLAELNVIRNAFEDTSIDVLFLVIDKEKATKDIVKEIYDCKLKKSVYNEESVLPDDWAWEIPREPIETEVIDIDVVNKELDDMTVKHLEKHLISQLLLIQFFKADIDYLGFINRCRILLNQYETMFIEGRKTECR